MAEATRGNRLDREIEAESLLLARLISRIGFELGIGEAAALAAHSLIDDMLDLDNVPEYLIPRAREARALCRMAIPSTGLLERAWTGALVDCAAGEAEKRG